MSELGAWEQVDWDASRTWIETALGAEWADAHAFFGRLVNHFVLETAPQGDLGQSAAERLRDAIRPFIPTTVDEIAPFAVRHVWNNQLADAARKDFFERLRRVSALAGGRWDVAELERRAAEIMGS